MSRRNGADPGGTSVADVVAAASGLWLVWGVAVFGAVMTAVAYVFVGEIPTAIPAEAVFGAMAIIALAYGVRRVYRETRTAR